MGKDNIASCILCWITAKGYYYQSYGKNHNMPVIAIIFEKYHGQNKNNVMIRFMKVIK